MNFTKATRLLNLPLNGPTFTETDIRKAYLKSSLKYHPDKYGDDGTAFKELHEAYVFMCERRKMQPDKIENSFDNILKEFISKFSQKKNWNNVFIQTTIKGIFMKCENYIINIFENLEKDIAIEVFDFLTQMQFFTKWDDKYIEKIKEIIHKKMKHDNIILLNPTLKDLMSDQIFKLNIGENIFYIPLWHNELYFDLIDMSSNKIDLIVKMIPDIGENILIDHNNNILIKKRAEISNIFNNNKLVVNVGGKEITIFSNEIKCIKEKQIFHFKKEGILKMDQKNIFNASNRADITIELELI